MIANIKEMDQSGWQCLKFAPESYYYGEVGYLDESNGTVLLKDPTDPKIKLVRHGFGVMIYKPNHKYQGYWEKDLKCGQGQLFLPDGSVYQGLFKEALFHESGKLQCANGDIYEGGWRRGKMEGPGVFKHHDGFALKGSFKANFFLDDTVLRPPAMSEAEYTAFKKQRKQIQKTREKYEKVKHGYSVQVTPTEVIEKIKLSSTNNRIALVCSLQESKFDLQSLLDLLETKGVYCFDLRKAYSSNPEDKFNFKQAFQKQAQKCLREGHTLLISLDESQGEAQFKQLYYPDLKQFYDTAGFNSSWWSREILMRKEVKDKVIGTDEIHADFKLVLWSKAKFVAGTDLERTREKFQLRLETVLPFIKVDIVQVKKPMEAEN